MVNTNWQRLFHNGREYFYNSVTNQSQWERPADYIPPPPPKKEYCVHCKEITPEWSIFLTNVEHEFFYNKKTLESTWNIPEDIMELVAELLNDDEDDEVEEYEEQTLDRIEVDADAQIVTQQELAPVVEPSLDLARVAAGIKRPISPIKEQSEPAKIPKLDQSDIIIQFKKMLNERANPFSSYSIESEKLHFDQYDLPKALKSKIFTEFCQLKSKEIIEQKKQHQKSQRDQFIDLLNDKVTKRMRFEDFRRASKKDARFMDSDEGRKLFDSHVKGLSDLDMKRKKREYLELLKTVVTRKDQSWVETRAKIETDERYLAIPTIVQREDFFRKYLETL